MNSNYTPFWLAAMYLPDVGPRKFMRWLALFPNIKSLFTATKDELTAKGFSAEQIKALHTINNKQIDADLLWASKNNQHILTLADPDYPSLLKQITDPPLVLFIRGNKSALQHPQIAMVGARNATPLGLQTAELLARKLTEAGLTVTSGLALGIDGASHKGALTGKGCTIGVTGTGLNHVYPRSHKKLVEAIVDNHGAVVSEFPLEAKACAWHFPRRNRIIAALSLGILVVEAALKSGSLITAQHALEFNREVFAVPGSIYNPLTRGCHYLLRQGAKVVESVADIIEELGAYSAIQLPETQGLHGSLSEQPAKDHRQILELIEYEITPMDVILLRSGLTAGKVSSILLILELDGYIQSVSGGYIRTVLNQ